ncbi:HAD-IIA family hydrolase [Natrialba swarupiae]|uniref:HAD-IIA family hydrolase n=1 Tax=Natrialba swarupiae TaxID=2448032 RepID=A0A5D5AQ58_9EURY|nr:HAD-IIA family hydrolase [Natrialba swarupiae]TYT63998.1 HAD-IIA family hydrolase [Natrialba swarupiae]
MSEPALEGALVDIDGTVFRGSEPIAGAPEGIETLREAGVRPVFLSNNATKRPSTYAEVLDEAGVPTEPASVLNAAGIAAAYLGRHHPDDGVYLIGESALRAELEAADVTLVADPARADVVLASTDRSFDYGTLEDVLAADEAGGVVVYATNPDRTVPTETGERPDCGPVIGAIEGLLGREIDRVLGKPSEVTIEVALERLGLEAEECVMIGDRLDTDVRMGERAGMRTVLVRSGVTDDDALAASELEPDHVIDSLGDVGRHLL